jgi:dTMP kinase
MYKFIVLEGIDGSGKTSVINYLRCKLAKEKVLFLKEPSSSSIGKQIRDLLSSNANLTEEEWIYLFTKDRTYNVIKNIIPNLNKTHIIMDRYFFSTIAYQSKDENHLKELFINFIDIFPIPTNTFLLDIDPEISLKRKNTSETFENLEKLKEVRANYFLIKELSDYFNIPFQILDSNTTISNISNQILDFLST